MKQINIALPRKIDKLFKDEAKRLFPKECYAIMVGHCDRKGNLAISDLYFPDVYGMASNTDEVNVLPEWWRHAERLAESKDMVLLGDIHSHPFTHKECKIYNASHAPSEADWLGTTGANPFWREWFVQGICVIRETKAHKLLSSMKFWGTPPCATVELC
jgi:hypothetical protein